MDLLHFPRIFLLPLFRRYLCFCICTQRRNFLLLVYTVFRTSPWSSTEFWSWNILFNVIYCQSRLVWSFAKNRLVYTKGVFCGLYQKRQSSVRVTEMPFTYHWGACVHIHVLVNFSFGRMWQRCSGSVVKVIFNWRFSPRITPNVPQRKIAPFTSFCVAYPADLGVMVFYILIYRHHTHTQAVSTELTGQNASSGWFAKKIKLIVEWIKHYAYKLWLVNVETYHHLFV